jgi:hypothetical protein
MDPKLLDDPLHIVIFKKSQILLKFLYMIKILYSIIMSYVASFDEYE